MHNSPATPKRDFSIKQFLEVTAPLHSPATDQKDQTTPRTSKHSASSKVRSPAFNFNSAQSGSLFAPKTSPITPEDKMMHPSNCMTTPVPKRANLFPNCLMNKGIQSLSNSIYKNTKLSHSEGLNHNLPSQTKQQGWQKKLFFSTTSSPEKQNLFESPTHSTASTKRNTKIQSSLQDSILPKSLASPSPKLINFKKCSSEMRIRGFDEAIEQEHQEQQPSLPPTADQTQFQAIKGGNSQQVLRPKISESQQNFNRSLFQNTGKEVDGATGYSETFKNLNLLKQASFGIPSSRDSCAQTPTFLHQNMGELARVINSTKIQSPERIPHSTQIDTSSTSSFNSAVNNAWLLYATDKKIESPQSRENIEASIYDDKGDQIASHNNSMKSSTFQYKNDMFPIKGFQNDSQQESPEFLRQQSKKNNFSTFSSKILGQSNPTRHRLSQFAPKNTPSKLYKNYQEKSEYTDFERQNPLDTMTIQISSPSQIQDQEYQLPQMVKRQSLVSAWRAGDKSLAQFKSGLTPFRPKNVLKGTKKQLFRSSDDQEDEQEEQDQCHRDSIGAESSDGCLDKEYDDDQINQRYMKAQNYQMKKAQRQFRNQNSIDQGIECKRKVNQNNLNLHHMHTAAQNSSWHSKTVNKLLSPQSSLYIADRANFHMNLFQRQNSNEFQSLIKSNKVFIKQSSFPVQGASSYDGLPIDGANNYLRPQFAKVGGNRVSSSFIPKKGQKNPYAITTPYGQRKQKRCNRSQGAGSMPRQLCSLQKNQTNPDLSNNKFFIKKYSIKSSLDSQKSLQRGKLIDDDKVQGSNHMNSEEQDENSSSSSICDQQQAVSPSNAQQQKQIQRAGSYAQKNLSTPPKRGIRIDAVLDTPEPVKVKQFTQEFDIKPQPFDVIINKSTRKTKHPPIPYEQITANQKDMVNIQSPQRMDVETSCEVHESYTQKIETQQQFFSSEEDNYSIQQSSERQRSKGYNKFFINIPQRFDHDFKMIKVLGNGSFGTVLKCQSRLDRLLYAIKKRTIKVKSRNRINEVLNEIYALAATSTCEKNQNIVKYYNGWFEDGNLFIVMELCRKSLQKVAQIYRQKNKIMSQNKIRKIMREVTLGLNGLHQKEIVHLDIKPENTLISYGGVYKIGDLGLAKLVSKQADRQISEGDSRYMAKQLLNDWYLNDLPDLRKADIFSLGAMMYELMSGVALESNGNEWQQLRNGSPNIEALLKRGYSQQMCQWIKRMLHPDTKQRPFCSQLLDKFLLSQLETKYRASQERVKELQLQVQRLKLQIKTEKQPQNWCFQEPKQSFFKNSIGLERQAFEDNDQLSCPIDL